MISLSLKYMPRLCTEIADTASCGCTVVAEELNVNCYAL